MNGRLTFVMTVIGVVQSSVPRYLSTLFGTIKMVAGCDKRLGGGGVRTFSITPAVCGAVCGAVQQCGAAVWRADGTVPNLPLHFSGSEV